MVYEHDEEYYENENEIEQGESCASSSCIQTICLLCDACLCACPAMDDAFTHLPYKVTILGRTQKHLVEKYSDEWAEEHGYQDLEDAQAQHPSLRERMLDYQTNIPVIT